MTTLRAYVHVFVVPSINMRRRWNRNGPSPPSRYLEERFIGLVSFVSQRLRVLGDTRWLRRYSILEGRVYRASSMERMCVWKWRGPLLRIPAAKITAALNFNGGDDKY